MFGKILIANRGEITCRVMRTARRLGVATVAVYSDADAGARHVRLADQARRIGPAPARQSYLDGAAIVEAALSSGAEAIHPGYGFLSENAGFAQSCADAGLVFIGPPPAAIRAMGSKSAAKTLMAAAGVPVTPGYHGDDQDLPTLAAAAAAIGYPVLIKASAGGGGRGMRRVDRAADFATALDACRRESLAAFGDDRVLVEAWVTRPRHVEIQVFADHHGACVHLFERDCSVQRRHQKVIEEAPAPGMTPERRAAMGAAAVDAARAIGYRGAGTVEFIVDRDGGFSFMEMNTRLQVEHPVTEMITGLDLVEWQLRVACGEPLPLRQDQLRLDGHAIEVRLYAEDPERGFLPSSGRIHHLATPPETDWLRLDSGVDEGDTVAPHYDPMLAKLVVRGDDRAEALARLRQALAAVRIVGVASNTGFLARLAALPAFTAADLDTGLIDREAARLRPSPAEAPDEVWRVAALAELLRQRRDAARRAAASTDPDSPWHACDAWVLNASPRQILRLRQGDTVRAIEAIGGDPADAAPSNSNLDAPPDLSLDRSHHLVLDGRAEPARGRLGERHELLAWIGDRCLHAAVVPDGARRLVFIDGQCWTLSVDAAPDSADGRGPAAAHRRDDPGSDLRAPMPGRVAALLVEPGTTVSPGTPLLVLEAMKMEHTITAPAAGVVRAHRHAPGDQVSEGDLLVDFEPLA